MNSALPPIAGRKRIAIVGGGISGLAAAYELVRHNADLTLFESSSRLGGIIETVRTQDFVIECGPDSWVGEKPWARALAAELGLEGQIISSEDLCRRTYLLQNRESSPKLVALPDGMRMMVPAKWPPVLESPLLSWQARLAYLREPRRAAELKTSAPQEDESVAAFVRRHFGDEVTETFASPLLAAVFGGDIAALSVRATMPALVQMEAEYGSLIHAVRQLQRRSKEQKRAQQEEAEAGVFLSLRTGLGTLVDAIAARLPAGSIQLRQPVLRLSRSGSGWRLSTPGEEHLFSAVILATPLDATRDLLRPVDARMSDLLPRDVSSAILVALAFQPAQAARMRIPRGFGFIAPSTSPPMNAGPRQTSEFREPDLLACTFVNQKFSYRAPEGAVLLRVFFGGQSCDAFLKEPDSLLEDCAKRQLSRIFGPLPAPAHAVVRRWPRSLPQYAVGHPKRIAELQSLAAALSGLYLAGNSYHGVGLPDLIRDGRAIARKLIAAGAGL